MPQPRRMVLVALALAASGCVQHLGPPPSPGSPVMSWVVQSPDHNNRTIYLRNDTPRPVTVSTITLTHCTNTFPACDDYPVNLTIEPGKVVQGMRVQQLKALQNWSFLFSLRMKRDSSEAGTQGAGSWPGEPLSDDVPTIPVEMFLPAVDPVTVGGKCSGASFLPPRNLPKGHRALQFEFDVTKTFAPELHLAMKPMPVSVRTVTVLYDGLGNAYQYSDRRGELEIVIFRPSTTTRFPGKGPHTRIELDLSRGMGTVVNTDSLNHAVSFHVTNPGLLTAESLGRPGEMIARIWKECGQGK